MEFRRVIRRKIRRRDQGIDVVADVNIVAAGNLDRSGSDPQGRESDRERSSTRGGEDDDEAGVPRDDS